MPTTTDDFVLPGFVAEYTLVAYTRDDLLDLAELPSAMLGAPLRLHLRGATLEFPAGVDEIQLRRLTDYASVLDWHGKDLQ